MDKNDGNRDKIKSLVNINKMTRDETELDKGHYLNDDEEMNEEEKMP